MTDYGFDIQAEGLSKTYFRRRLLDVLRRRSPEETARVGIRSLSLSISAGESVGIVGPNGAGKSTLFKLMCGIIAPTEGSIVVGGWRPQEDRRRFTRHIGVVMGHKNMLWWDIPARHSLRFCAALYDIGDESFEERRDYLVGALGLSNLLESAPKRLSLGQRRLIECACACLHAPELLLLDEPAIGLDIVVRNRLAKVLKHMQEEYGTTIVLVSHSLDDVDMICDRALVMKEGGIIFDGSLDDLRRLDKSRGVRVSLDGAPGERISIKVPGAQPQVFRKAGDVQYQCDVPEALVSPVLSALLDRYHVRNVEIGAASVESVLLDLYEEEPGRGGERPHPGPRLETSLYCE